MDPVSAIGLGGFEVNTQTASQGMVGLDSEAFMNLLVAQLRYQDPLAPTDANALLQQTSVLAQTELLTQLSAVQQQLLGMQTASTATSMIGHDVEGLTSGGQEISGEVDAVRFDVGGPVLIIGDLEVSLNDATRIGAAAATPTQDPAG